MERLGRAETTTSIFEWSRRGLEDWEGIGGSAGVPPLDSERRKGLTMDWIIERAGEGGPVALSGDASAVVVRRRDEGAEGAGVFLGTSEQP